MANTEDLIQLLFSNDEETWMLIRNAQKIRGSPQKFKFSGYFYINYQIFFVIFRDLADKLY